MCLLWLLSLEPQNQRKSQNKRFHLCFFSLMSRRRLAVWFPAPSLPAPLNCARCSIFSLPLPLPPLLLRDVGGWNRATSRPLSVGCARDVTDRDVLLDHEELNVTARRVQAGSELSVQQAGGQAGGRREDNKTKGSRAHTQSHSVWFYTDMFSFYNW